MVPRRIEEEVEEEVKGKDNKVASDEEEVLEEDDEAQVGKVRQQRWQKRWPRPSSRRRLRRIPKTRTRRS